jgi:ABC-type maltose transport system permease subunit
MSFAKYEFPGKRIVFLAFLSSLMVPTEMLIIPWFIMAAHPIVGSSWIDTYWGIAFPGMITATGIFLMRQFMQGVPDELLDAARIDGVSEFGLFWRIAVPLSLPAIGALCIFNFLAERVYLAVDHHVSARHDDSARGHPVFLHRSRLQLASDYDRSLSGADTTADCRDYLPTLHC